MRCALAGLLVSFLLSTAWAAASDVPDSSAQAVGEPARAELPVDLEPPVLPRLPRDEAEVEPLERARRTWAATVGAGILHRPCAAQVDSTCVGSGGLEGSAGLAWRPSPYVSWGLALVVERGGSLRPAPQTALVIKDNALALELVARAYFYERGSFDPFLFASAGYGRIERSLSGDLPTEDFAQYAARGSAGGGIGWLLSNLTRAEVFAGVTQWVPVARGECNRMTSVACPFAEPDQLFGLGRLQLGLRLGISGLFGDRL